MFHRKKCPCCFCSNIKFVKQTMKEMEKQNKRIQKLGEIQYILTEYNVQVDESLRGKVEEFYAELDKQRRIQFKKDIEEINRNSPKPYNPRKPAIVPCPYCKSTDTEKISTLSRSASFGLFGFGSKKIGKQWKCNNCKSYF